MGTEAGGPELSRRQVLSTAGLAAMAVPPGPATTSYRQARATCKDHKPRTRRVRVRGHSYVLRIKLWGRWDSNPHHRAPKARASAELGYGPFLFASLPANVGVCEWQFGQRKRRFSFLLSNQSPLT